MSDFISTPEQLAESKRFANLRARAAMAGVQLYETYIPHIDFVNRRQFRWHRMEGESQVW